MVPEAVDHAEGMACPSPAPPPILPGTGPRSGPKAQLGGGPGCSHVDTAHGQSLCGNRCQINTCLWAGGHAGREAGCVRAEALEGRARLTGWSGWVWAWPHLPTSRVAWAEQGRTGLCLTRWAVEAQVLRHRSCQPWSLQTPFPDDTSSLPPVSPGLLTPLIPETRD